MTRYIGMVDGKPGAFGLVFPDAPGCVAMGRTIDELLIEGAEVLTDWMGYELDQRGKLPKARTPEQLRKDSEVREALASGSIFVSIPLVVDSGQSARANISLDAGLLSAIDEEARRRGVTRSAFLAAAARDKIRESA